MDLAPAKYFSSFLRYDTRTETWCPIQSNDNQMLNLGEIPAHIDRKGLPISPSWKKCDNRWIEPITAGVTLDYLKLTDPYISMGLLFKTGLSLVVQQSHKGMHYLYSI